MFNIDGIKKVHAKEHFVYGHWMGCYIAHLNKDYLMKVKDYSLTGENGARAVEAGLAEADWYQTPLPRATMRELLQRRNGPALRDTALLLVLLAGTGYAFSALWGTWWAVIPYFIYAVLYGTGSDSRWHECSHGTAFRTDWMTMKEATS